MLVHSGGIHLLYPTPLDLLSTRPQICLQQNREQGSLMAFFCSRFLNFWSGGFVSGTPKTFRPSNLGHTPYLISDSSTRLYCPVSMSLSFRYRLGLNAMLSVALAVIGLAVVGRYLVSCFVGLYRPASYADIGFAGVLSLAFWYLVFVGSCGCAQSTNPQAQYQTRQHTNQRQLEINPMPKNEHKASHKATI